MSTDANRLAQQLLAFGNDRNVVVGSGSLNADGTVTICGQNQTVKALPQTPFRAGDTWKAIYVNNVWYAYSQDHGVVVNSRTVLDRRSRPQPVPKSGSLKVLYSVDDLKAKTTTFYVGGDRPTPTAILTVPKSLTSTQGTPTYTAYLHNLGSGLNDWLVSIYFEKATTSTTDNTRRIQTISPVASKCWSLDYTENESYFGSFFGTPFTYSNDGFWSSSHQFFCCSELITNPPGSYGVIPTAFFSGGNTDMNSFNGILLSYSGNTSVVPADDGYASHFWADLSFNSESIWSSFYDGKRDDIKGALSYHQNLIATGANLYAAPSGLSSSSASSELSFAQKVRLSRNQTLLIGQGVTNNPALTSVRPLLSEKGGKNVFYFRQDQRDNYTSSSIDYYFCRNGVHNKIDTPVFTPAPGYQNLVNGTIYDFFDSEDTTTYDSFARLQSTEKTIKVDVFPYKIDVAKGKLVKGKPITVRGVFPIDENADSIDSVSYCP